VTGTAATLARRALRHPLPARLAGPYLVRQRPPADVVVAQMGKVGSQAVTASLEAAGLRTAHVHFLSRSGLRRAERVYEAHWDPARLPWHIWEGRRTVARLRSEERLDIVTAVRDPVARNVSSFFQVADLQYGIELGALEDAAALEDVTRLFLETFDEHELPLRWLDDELRAATGLDVYESDFDVERGWSVTEGDRARILVLRTDRLGDTFTAAVEAFLGRPGIALLQRNVSAEKATGELYDEFRRRARLPEAYLDQMYNSRVARHFFDDDELAELRRLWTGVPIGEAR
jgi:hypothetical protein